MEKKTFLSIKFFDDAKLLKFSHNDIRAHHDFNINCIGGLYYSYYYH